MSSSPPSLPPVSPEGPLLSLQDLKVGMRFVSGSHTFKAEEIIRYAKQFDPQAFHIDEALAAKSAFGGLVASGWHTVSTCMRLIVESIHLDCGLIGIEGTIKWLKPVKPESTVHVESEILNIVFSRSKPGQAVVTVRCNVVNEQGVTVIEFVPKLMAFAGAAISTVLN